MKHRFLTYDRSYMLDMSYFAPERVGRTRRITPEGFLVCEGVPIARTGTQIYHESELDPVLADGSGIIRVERSPEEVFASDTIASFEGKPLTIEHPENGVTPENWRRLAVGHIQNVRRGSGFESDLLVGDLLVTDPLAIEHVNSKMPQISAGYEADYISAGRPGTARQQQIRGNHVAFVKQGRAGSRVAVRDSLGVVMKTPDARLDPLPARKGIDLCKVWKGDLKSEVDGVLDDLTTWETPFCIGYVLTAEQVPAYLDGGRRWDGALEKLNRARDSSPEEFKQSGMEEVATGATMARDALRARDVRKMRDAKGCLAAAMANVNFNRSTGDSSGLSVVPTTMDQLTRYQLQIMGTQDSGSTHIARGALTPGMPAMAPRPRVTGDSSSKAPSIAEIQRHSNEFWDAHTRAWERNVRGH